MKTSTRMPFGLIAFLMLVWQVGFGQVTIISETLRDGSLPSGWSQMSVTFSTSAGGYALMSASNSELETPAFDASSYLQIDVSLSVAKFGSGGNGPVTVEYSLNGGTDWVVAGNSSTPTSSSYVNDVITIASVSANMVIRFTRASSPSQKRLRDIVIEGTSSDPEPTNHPTNFIAATGSPATSAIDMVWDDAIGAQLPVGYVIMGNTTGTFTDPVDGTDPAQDTDLSDGSALVKVAQGVENYSFTGLNSSTQYFFKIWPYTNSGSNIDFKTDGTPGEDNATTEAECGITALGSASYSCDSNTSGADNDFVTVNISYTGVDAGATLTITSGGGSESNTGDNPTSVSNGTISFAAIEGDAWSVTITGGNCNLSANGTVPSTECDPIPTVADIRINEVDADTPGTDSDEFIELFSPGAGNYALDGLVLVLFNGSGDESYNAFDLDGFQTDGNGFFIIGSIAGAEIDVPAGGSGWLQNGADAVALYYASDTDFPTGTSVTSTNLIDALVYDTNDGDDSGLLSGLGETDQINEGGNGDSANESIQRGSWFVASPTPRAVNLPVSLVDLQGKKIDNQVLLTFSTSTEQNNSHFLIQRSVDGRVFENIGRVEGAGDSDQAINYSFVDDKPLPGLNYYRLHQFDFDGTNEIFGPIAVRFGEAGDKPSAWPVPTSDLLQVSLPATEESWLLEVFNLNGQRLLEQLVEDKTTQISLDVRALPAGSYFLRWTNGRNSGQQRFLKN